MAYNTQALSLLSPGFLCSGPLNDSGILGANVWVYNTADSEATVKGAAYFSDGDKKGMKVGDMVIVVLPATPAIYLLLVSAVTAGTGATVTTGVAVT